MAKSDQGGQAPLMDPVTAQAIERLVANPSHAISLTGPRGAGKKYLATYISEQVVGRPASDWLLQVGEQGEIGIDDIRKLQRFLQLRTPGKAAWRRAVIINDADNMGIEAQNALLKSLEEPPADTLFVLTMARPALLKATIHSRVQPVTIKPIGLDQAKEAYADKASTDEITKAYHLSGGYVGLLTALINDEDHPLTSAISEAKQLLQAPVFERLIKVDKLAKQRDELPGLLYALQRLIGAVLKSSAGSSQKSTKLVRSARYIYQAEQDLARNTNPKLVLTDLFLNL